MSLHPHLLRQLRRLGIADGQAPDAEAWAALLERVSSSYSDADKERYLNERSVAISSREMRELHEGIARREAEQSALRRIATEIARGRGTEKVFDMVSLEVAGVLGVEAARVLRYLDDEKAEVAGVFGANGRLGRAGLVSDTIPASRALASGMVRDTGRPAWVDTYASSCDPHARSLTARGIHCGVGAPIRVEGRLWGAVLALSTRPDGLREGSEHRLTDFASLAALAVTNDSSWRRLSAQATSDALTGLSNHREFHERLDVEVWRASRHERPLSLVILDIDCFKPLNDIFGHQAGDRVLVEVARRLRRIARRGEILGRIGGEEFAWLLPETDIDGAVAAAERARLAIGRTPFPDVGAVTVSAGACDLDTAGSAADLIRLADGALYWAKRSGRDVVVRYAPEHVEDLSASEHARRLQRDAQLGAVRVLARAVDARDDVTQRHSERVAAIASALAEVIGWSPDQVSALRDAALVHDVGKLGVPEAVLQKTTPLTDDDWAAIRQHAELGAEIVRDILSPDQVLWIRHHHERADGRGYPDGITDGRIPEGAAILALADAWDAMTSARPYSPIRSTQEALAECVRESGRHFVGTVVDALEELARADRLPVPDLGAEAGPGGAVSRASISAA